MEIDTTDVEKIARELAVTICDRFGMTYPTVGFLGSQHWQEVTELIRPAFAQASAPLVAALEKLDAIAARACSDREGTKMIWASAVMAVTRAALTGHRGKKM